MNYIVFDLEFNQEPTSLNIPADRLSLCPYEIVQIGAIRLDADLSAKGTFNRYIKPSIYLKVNDFITQLTGITTEQLAMEKGFPEVFDDFLQFLGDDCILCTWGLIDMKEMYRNAAFYGYDRSRLPERVINLQPQISVHLKQSPKKLLQLKAAVEALSIPIPYPFHNALYDAYYTAQLFKKLSGNELIPVRYSPDFHSKRPLRPKPMVDYDGLLQQFQKMYQRELTKEEKDMITLSYKMGRTQQFVIQGSDKDSGII
jgi:DNA polymerase III epsilon subunit-like protein